MQADTLVQSATAAATWILVVVGIATWFLARKSARQELRAYLEVNFRWKNGDIDVPGDLNLETLQAAVFVMNVGQTPALNVRFQGATQILQGPPSIEQIGQVVAEGEKEPARLCFPHSLPLYFRMPNHDSKQVCSDGEHVYAAGTITYDDVFGEHHSTKFCCYWSSELKRLTGSGWNQADAHNSAT